jgi:hypothetical protein
VSLYVSTITIFRSTRNECSSPQCNIRANLDDYDATNRHPFFIINYHRSLPKISKYHHHNLKPRHKIDNDRYHSIIKHHRGRPQIATSRSTRKKRHVQCQGKKRRREQKRRGETKNQHHYYPVLLESPSSGPDAQQAVRLSTLLLFAGRFLTWSLSSSASLSDQAPEHA